MNIGYVRVSTVDQDAGFEAQVRELKAIGVDEIFSERISSMVYRPKFEEALCHCRQGDTLVVTKIDRLARSISELVKIISALNGRGAHLKIINLGLDTSSPTGALIINILGSIAQFEREIMLERQREGIKKAKDAGKYKGRKPLGKETVIFSLRKEGKSGAMIAKELGISERSVWRALQQ